MTAPKRLPSLSGVKFQGPGGDVREYAKPVFSITEAGALVGLKRAGAYKAVSEGRLRATSPTGGRQKVTAEAVDRYLHPEEWTDEPAAEAAPEPYEFSGEVEVPEGPLNVYTPPRPEEDPHAEARRLGYLPERDDDQSGEFLQYDKPSSRRPRRRRQIVAGPVTEVIPESWTETGAHVGGGKIEPEALTKTQQEWEAEDLENRTTKSGVTVCPIEYYNGPNFF